MSDRPIPRSGHLSRRTVLASILAGFGAAQLASPVLARAGVRAQSADAWGAPVRGRDIFVDPAHGDDTWRGNQPEPVPGANGPLATLEEATRRAYAQARKLNAEDDRDFVHVWLRGGTYRRTEPWVPGRHGTAVQVRFLAYPGERPVISASQELTGWEPATVNGVSAWKTTVPEARDGRWVFTQLYVDGRSRPRPRLPKSVNRLLESGQTIPPDDPDFFHRFQPGTSTGVGQRKFAYRTGDIDPDWYDLTHIDVVAMDAWYDERSPIESVDPVAHTCTVAFRPYETKAWGLRDYYVENVREALTEPGEWYLDRRTGDVHYIPLPGETPDTVTISAPRARHLLRVEGSVDAPVEHLTFGGLSFEHTSWDYWRRPTWETGQSAVNTVGAVVFREARDCTLTGCTIRFVGEYGLTLEEGCRQLAVTHNEIADTGSGGIKMASNTRNPSVVGARTGENQITDNHIHDTGRVFHMGAGILAMDTYANTIAHNHIHDLYYTGISVGWGWTFDENPARDNVVEYNHVHHLSKGPLLSDLGGIYTLSRQPGTRIANNYVHDVYARKSFAFGLYADEGSSFMRFENNLVHDAVYGFFLHFGAENLVRNNVLVHNRGAALAVGNRDRRGVGEYSLRVHHNVLVAEGGQVFQGGYAFTITDQGVDSDDNLVWNTHGDIGGNGTWWDLWRSTGRESRTVVADPKFKDPSRNDFGLAPDSPAFAPPVDFQAIDMSSLGPRPAQH